MAAGSVNQPRVWLRAAALGVFGFYLAWNAYYLAHGQLPPSLLLGIFGLPAPTTGCTRSALCLLRGDVARSLFWNACLLPLLVILLLSGGLLTASILRRRPPVLPRPVGNAWIFLLVLAWLIKLAQGRSAW